MTPTPPTDGAAELLKRQLDRLIIENQSEDGSIDLSDQACMRDEILTAFATYLRTIESKLPSLTLNEVIEAGMTPTKDEYEKMVWVDKWYETATHALLTAEIEAITKENE